MLLKLLFRNGFRHKLRTLLTLTGLCVAVLAFGLLRTVVDAWYAGVSASSATRLVTRNAISLTFPLPLSYKEKIRSVEGVKNVAFANWFGGFYIDMKNFFANFAVDAEGFLEMYPEYVLQEKEKSDFLKDRKGCVVGEKLAKRFGWRIGDTITLTGTIFPGKWELVVRAIYKGRYKTTDVSQLFFHWEYLNEYLKKHNARWADHVGFFFISVTNADLAPVTAEAVDRLFKNSFAETLTETEKAFQLGFVAMTEAILMVIRLVSFIVIAIIMAVVANTMAMSVRERLGEYAVFKTLGFGGSYLILMIFGESLLISSLGTVAGILCTYPAVDVFTRNLGEFFPIFHLSARTIRLQIAAGISVGLVAAIFPSWRAATIPIAEGMGRMG
ncbi:MAG: FtsX-like permease family protein [Desulfobacteraceae bacterium]|nr:MAG: FtsX-like permease family protein [Desulfobacteraceae bacterium]